MDRPKARTFERRLAKRVPLDLRTRLRHSGLHYAEITISDLSFTGFKGVADVPLHKGALVSIALPHIGLVRAVIKWCEGAMVAGEFRRAVDVRACFREKV